MDWKDDAYMMQVTFALLVWIVIMVSPLRLLASTNAPTLIDTYLVPATNRPEMTATDVRDVMEGIADTDTAIDARLEATFQLQKALAKRSEEAQSDKVSSSKQFDFDKYIMERRNLLGELEKHVKELKRELSDCVDPGPSRTGSGFDKGQMGSVTNKTEGGRKPSEGK